MYYGCQASPVSMIHNQHIACHAVGMPIFPLFFRRMVLYTMPHTVPVGYLAANESPLEQVGVVVLSPEARSVVQWSRPAYSKGSRPRSVVIARARISSYARRCSKI